MPMPSASPDREIILMEMPLKYISKMAVRILSGMEQAIIIVGRRLFINTINTNMARSAPKSIFSTTELMIISM